MIQNKKLIHILRQTKNANYATAALKNISGK